MPTIEVTLDATRALRELKATMNQVMLVRLAELLNTDNETALDWLTCKVAAFRGISEQDVSSELTISDRRV